MKKERWRKEERVADAKGVYYLLLSEAEEH